MQWIKLLVLFIALPMSAVMANEVEILKASFAQNKQGNWNISVTLEHQDAGWKHYANLWQVVDDNNQVLAKRVLHHPHDDEQPFTRALKNVNIPSSVKVVFIEAQDLKHGWASSRLKIDLSQAKEGRLLVQP